MSDILGSFSDGARLALAVPHHRCTHGSRQAAVPQERAPVPGHTRVHAVAWCGVGIAAHESADNRSAVGHMLFLCWVLQARIDAKHFCQADFDGAICRRFAGLNEAAGLAVLALIHHRDQPVSAVGRAWGGGGEGTVRQNHRSDVVGWSARHLFHPVQRNPMAPSPPQPAAVG